jgi:hypothetical protein
MLRYIKINSTGKFKSDAKKVYGGVKKVSPTVRSVIATGLGKAATVIAPKRPAVIHLPEEKTDS